MSRPTSLDHYQQISLFEPLFNLKGVALAPAVNATPHPSQSTNESADSVFSEISLSGRSEHCLQLIAPILRELSEGKNDRWLTLVSPPKHITAQWLRNAGLNRERILVLRPRGLQSSQELACEALRLGCSHTVVSWFNPLPRAARDRLISAAQAGTTQILNICQPFTI